MSPAPLVNPACPCHAIVVHTHLLMKSLPIPARSLAIATLGAVLSASALAQAPAPAAATPGSTPTAPAATPAAKPLSPTEKNFVVKAGKSIAYQLQLANAAKTAVSDEKLAKLRDTTIKELNKAWEALTKIAAAHGETMSGELSAGDKSGIERMGKLKDEKFAKQWVEELNKESKKLDRDFETAAKTAQDPELKTFAANYGPMIHNVFTSSEAAEKVLKKK